MSLSLGSLASVIMPTFKMYDAPFWLSTNGECHYMVMLPTQVTHTGHSDKRLGRAILILSQQRSPSPAKFFSSATCIPFWNCACSAKVREQKSFWRFSKLPATVVTRLDEERAKNRHREVRLSR